MPAVFQEVQLNVEVQLNTSPSPSNGIPSSQIQQRIMLISSDSSTKVSIGTNRIDFEIIANDDLKLSIEQRIKINQNAVKTFRAIFEKFNKTANRLALNTESLIINLTSDEFAVFMKQYSNPISLYNNVPMDEWGTRLMVRQHREIGRKTETLNVITILEKQIMQKIIDGKTIQHDGFAANIDINTIPENTASRFEVEHIEEFISIAVEIWDRIIEELDGIK